MVDSNVSPSPAIVATPTPDAGVKQDFKKARVSESSSKIPPTVSIMAEQPEIIATDKAGSLGTMEEKPTIPTSKTETSQKLNDRKIAESTMIGSRSLASQASVNAGGVTGQSQPIAVVSSGRSTTCWCKYD
uniref:Phenylalanine--tRNA ligase alpha subunit n=1 Tax=Lygus hesperus TaxID=30085 RepID=A0A0A9XQH4_LYGHE